MSAKKFKIFLSHIHEEREIAIFLKQKIEEEFLRAVEVFVSSDDSCIGGGDLWLSRISEELEECNLVLILASPKALKRPWINFEAGAGWFMNKKVIPVCIKGVTPLTLEQPLKSLQVRNIEIKDDLRGLLFDIANNSNLDEPKSNINELFSKVKEKINSIDTIKSVEIDSNENENKIFEKKERKNDELPSLKQKSTVFFSNRIESAFPGVRGTQWFTKSDICVNRLEIMLRAPLKFNPHKDVSGEPIWYWRGGASESINSFERIDENKCLINDEEFIIDKIAVHRNPAYFRQFIYVETKPEKPTGIYNDYEEIISSQLDFRNYAIEEYGLYREHIITRSEYDDGAAVIDDKVIDVINADLRIRYLTKYNFIISAQFAPFNSREFDILSRSYLNNALENNNNKLDELFTHMSNMERHKNDV
ncbi:toll/interleukin-1 receptor domain-containing protein [Halanaerobium congolense]|jgi:hypothetical protein|uniref:TIR domain-containing protein n=1 Tax=Halanaerobium congolense TaxID=54121 RepID=A0A1G8RSI5_9FIRM|nr:toll/interleukin-1 receptor domain-containing protein [Halanaerobium congolense]SDJ19320.1 TIR domain-containing protein [Halanaerobium congolense]SDL06077.1 TIR domain-containing protein [Halanaerobium congolense]SDN16510.1 TIR domain-containing protein [Halanaerobium congolense]SET76577.1 TIR domain-containing protein [Halanaerobium congolense]